MVWLATKNGIFSVKSFYSSLANRKTELYSMTIWNFWVPLRINLFAWELTWTRILTLDKLKRKSWWIPNRCYMCKVEEETSDHFLLHCSKSHILWLLIYALSGVQWVMDSLVKGVILSYYESFVGKKEKRLGRLFRYTCFRPYKEREMGELLIIVKAWTK